MIVISGIKLFYIIMLAYLAGVVTLHAIISFARKETKR